MEDKVEVNSEQFEASETELYVKSEWKRIPEEVYLRVEQIYECDGDTFLTLVPNVEGPEYDILAEEVTSAIGNQLERRSYDPQMHD